MGWVPDTDTFSLNDVVAVTGGTSLSAAFTNSDDLYFDATYKGSKDRLSNFRNYGYDTLGTYPDYSATGNVYISGTVWSTIRAATEGDDFNTADPIIIKAQRSGSYYYIHRAFLCFDLSSLSGKTAVSATLFWGRRTYGGVDNSVYIYAASQGDPLDELDYDAFSFSQSLFNTSIEWIYQGGTPCPYYLKAVCNSTDLTYITSNFMGTNMKICIVSYNDSENEGPADGENNYSNMFISGETGTGVNAPYLSINYR